MSLIVWMVLIAVGGAGCARSVGRGVASPIPSGSASASAPVWRPPPPAGPFRSGDCLAFDAASTLVPVACDQPHQHEVMLSADLPADLRVTYPPRTGALKPLCAIALTGYLASPDAEATRLEEVVRIPSRAQWDGGDRWYACTVAERGPDNYPVRRTGTVAGALAGGFGAFQRCLVGDPLDDPLQVVPCERAHRSEAVPGVLVLGAPTDPVPDIERMFRERIIPHCQRAVAAYLGGDRPGVSSSGLGPLAENWVDGVRTAICYAKVETPVTGLLSGR